MTCPCSKGQLVSAPEQLFPELPSQYTFDPSPQNALTLQGGQGSLHQVVTPLQVTCPRSLTGQSRSAAEQTAPGAEVEQLTGVPLPQSAEVLQPGQGSLHQVVTPLQVT